MLLMAKLLVLELFSSTVKLLGFPELSTAELKEFWSVWKTDNRTLWMGKTSRLKC